MSVQKRSLKIEKLARIYDDEIAPVWGTRFGKMLLRNLALPERGQVLDISCGTGYPTIEILRRMTEGSRLIAIDASSAMLDVARRKVADLGPLGKKGVFFRTESPVPKLSFADDVYDLVVCNLGLDEMPSLDAALRDFARVAKVGGEVRCTLPLAGTFQEFHDLYREVLIKHDKHDALERLETHIAHYPTLEHVERCMADAQLDGHLEVEEFTLLFKSSREFFFAPVIEYGPLSDWKEIAGGGQEMQDVFWYIKEAIDAYFEGRPFQVTVKAGCLIGKKHEASAVAQVPDVIPHSVDEIDLDNYDTPAFEELAAPEHLAVGSVQMADADDLDVQEISHSGAHDFAIDLDSNDEPIEAFVDGAQRPMHLDEFDQDQNERPTLDPFREDDKDAGD